MAEANAYEEMRRRQVEENKRKLEELRLHQLSAAVREANAKPKTVRKWKARAWKDGPLRRSGRLAGHPAEDFSCRKDANDVSNTVANEEIAYTITKAQEFAEKLGSDHPTFVKFMSSYFVTGAMELYLPAQFNDECLGLGKNETVVLVDEADTEVEMFYRMNKKGQHFLSGDWRGFKVDHNLVAGDCLVFQLIERAKFKVYIMRASSLIKPRASHIVIRDEGGASSSLPISLRR